MSDRPVSLAAAISVIERHTPCAHENADTSLGDGRVWAKCEDCGAEFHQDRWPEIRANAAAFQAAIDVLRSAPATPDAPKSVEEMADAIGTILPCPFCGSSADHRGEAAYVRCTNLSCEAMGPSDDPTGSKWNAVPRGLPAPEWTGPDRWQHWIAESAYHPGDYAPLAPEGYKPVGPWECPCPPFVAANGTYNRDWRRPLRRVQA